jgi:hypothetical protein
MVIYKEVYANNFYEELWSGGLNTYNNLAERGISDEEIEQMLEEFFCGEEFVDIGKINDFLWFESDTVFDYFGISEDEDEDEDEDEEEE